MDKITGQPMTSPEEERRLMERITDLICVHGKAILSDIGRLTKFEDWFKGMRPNLYAIRPAPADMGAEESILSEDEISKIYTDEFHSNSKAEVHQLLAKVQASHAALRIQRDYLRDDLAKEQQISKALYEGQGVLESRIASLEQELTKEQAESKKWKDGFEMQMEAGEKDTEDYELKIQKLEGELAKVRDERDGETLDEKIHKLQIFLDTIKLKYAEAQDAIIERATKELQSMYENYKCGQKEHDDRWCQRCEAVKDGIDFAQQKIRSHQSHQQK